MPMESLRLNYTFINRAVLFLLLLFELRLLTVKCGVHGSILSSKHCSCDSVQYWLPDLAFNPQLYQDIEPGNKISPEEYQYAIPLWIPRACEIEHNGNKRTQLPHTTISPKVWLKYDHRAKCVSALIKCNNKLICVGRRTKTEDISLRFLKRKLLMLQSDSSHDNVNHLPFHVLLGISVICTMIIVLVICVKNKTSKEIVAYDLRDRSVKITSSNERLETRKPETTSDPSSNSRTAPLNVVVHSTQDTQDDAVDGNGLGKSRKIEENDLKEIVVSRNDDGGVIVNENAMEEDKFENEDKEHTKKSPSRQSHGSISDKPEHKTFLPKMRISLRGAHSNTSSKTYEKPKVAKTDKKKSKKNPESHAIPVTRKASSADRHSFINRELPKTPSQDFDEQPNVQKPEIPQDGDGTQGVAKLDLQAANDNDSGLYDSVDDSLNRKAYNDDDESDTYETVNTKSKLVIIANPTNGESTPPNSVLYESVRGSEYEDPIVGRERSFTDNLPGSSTPKTKAEKRSASVGHELRQRHMPTPPSLEQLKGREDVPPDVPPDIDPYTVTFKEGDRIVQETSISTHQIPAKNEIIVVNELTEEEKEKLYTKVDKAKKERDRQEAKKLRDEEEIKNKEHECENPASDKEHTYETLPRVPEKKGLDQEIDDSGLYEEVILKKDEDIKDLIQKSAV